MKILIAGLGSIGRRHFRNLIALGEKDIVLLRSHRATLSDDEPTGYPVETDIHKALNKHKPDAVVVANPTALHLDIAIPAAETGCAILLEKPVSDSLDRLDTLQQAARTHSDECHRQGVNCPCALGRVSSVVASMGGLSSELCGTRRSWRRCHSHAHASARLFALPHW